MKLKKLIANTKNYNSYNFKNLEIKGVSVDSRQVKAGDLFIAIDGPCTDGHRFISEAINNGAVGLIVDKTKARNLARIYKNKIVIAVSDTKQAFIGIVKNFYKDKIKGLKLIAVTGTNGKTTIAYLIESILNTAGFTTGLIGTIDYHMSGVKLVSTNTTPGLIDLCKIFAQMHRGGVEYVIMEASSHALEQDRVGGLSFFRGVFSNISRDHLDYHKNFKNYFAAKSKLFRLLKSRDACAVINIDDPYGRKLIRLTKAKKLAYAIKRKADCTAQGINLSAKETRFLIRYKDKFLPIESRLLGIHNVYNILAAVTLALSMGIKPQDVIKGVMRLKSVAGRLELVGRKGKAEIFIDYAHTPVALKALLVFFDTLKRQQHKKRIILVFGCGGNRDKIKRPQMGRIASRFADLTLLTSDNPRSEDPVDIIADIKKGMSGNNYLSIEDRYEAIKEALARTTDEDIVLIAGKGHERVQIFKDRKEEFSDSHAVRQALKEI